MARFVLVGIRPELHILFFGFAAREDFGAVIIGAHTAKGD
jgi:hypothetical protein